jgi:hypothetical protein
MTEIASLAGDVYHIYILFRHIHGSTECRYFQGRWTSLILGFEMVALT